MADQQLTSENNGLRMGLFTALALMAYLKTDKAKAVMRSFGYEP